MPTIEQRVEVLDAVLVPLRELLAQALERIPEIDRLIRRLQLGRPGQDTDDRISELFIERQVLDGRIPALQNQIAEGQPDRDALERDAEVQQSLGDWPGGNVPLVLLPVRIETRFDESAGPQLWVRIFPDDVHLDSHEPELTADEHDAASQFWHALWRTGSGDDAAALGRRSALRTEIVRRFGRPRADWIVTATTPTNPGDRPSQPIAAGGALNPAPTLDPVSLTEDEWARPATARALPDRWLVVGHRDGERVLTAVGAEIERPLAAGLDPSVDPDAVASGSIVDDAARWIVDFEEAQRVGMGLRIEISDMDLRTGFDTLIVFGVAASPDSAAHREELSGLLLAHRYSGGLGFVPTGAATNNTVEADADFRSDEDGVAAFRTESSGVAPAADSNGAHLAAVLGIDGDVVAHLPTSEARHGAAQRAMNTALWPATGGYYLDQFIAGAAIAKSDEAREHFVKHARPGGPLPSIRVGQQPYGVLPVSAFDDVLEPLAPGRDGLTGIARRMRPMWLDAAESVAHAAAPVDPTQEEAETLLLDVLKTGPASRTFEARPVVGVDVFNATPIIDEQHGPVVRQRQRRVRQLLRQLGLPTSLRISETIMASKSFAFNDTALRAGGEDGGLDPPTYIDWLITSPVETVRDELDLPDAAPAPNTLLFQLLRHSLLLAYGKAGFEIRREAGTAEPFDGVDPSWVDVLDPDTPTVGRHAAQPVAGMPPIHELTAADHPAGAALDELRAALHELRSMPAEALDHLLVTTLDAFSHRLDVWITSAATRRLDEARSTDKGAVALGGFGWLANVRARARNGSSHPSGNAGYVHAPSMGQAATAAVMRAGYLATTGENEARPLAIDLHSRRLYPALQLLEGVRNGQTLAELLGYRFERMLHDRDLDRYIDDFRRVVPLGRINALSFRIDMLGSGTVGPTPEQEVEIVRLKAERDAVVPDLRQEHLFPPQATVAEMADLLALTVVDGAALVDMWQTSGSFFNWRLSPPSRPVDLPTTGPDRDALVQILDELADAVDAAGDLLTAESIHQLVAGSPTRTGESLDSVLRGEAPPADFDVVRTPRTGLALTHRVVVLLDEADADANWPRTAMDVMAAAEPRLDRLAAEMLGDSAMCKTQARFVAADGETVLREQQVSVFDLELGALEVLHLASSGAAAFLSVLEARIHDELVVRDRPAGVPEDAVLHLDLAPSVDQAQGESSPSEFASLAVAVADTLLSSRPLERGDLVHDAAGPGTIDLVDLGGRVTAAVAALSLAVRDTESLLAQAGAVPSGALRVVLHRLSKFGIPEAQPRPAGPEADQDLIAQAASAVAVAASRLQAAQAAADRQPTVAPEQRVEELDAILQAVFGRGFVALPSFRAANGDELAATFANSNELQQGDPLASLEWLTDVATVREPVARFHRAAQFADVLGRRSVLALRVGQLPHREEDRWIALATAGDPEQDGRGGLAVVAHMPHPVVFQNPLSGLLIDEWTEVVPSSSETTGLTFHYDQPGTEAPNAILIAVTPDDPEAWDFVQLERTLVETFELAKMRAVDPQTLFRETNLDHVLPAMYVGLNLAADTVSTDMRRLK